jgi:hypothetical protein
MLSSTGFINAKPFLSEAKDWIAVEVIESLALFSHFDNSLMVRCLIQIEAFLFLEEVVQDHAIEREEGRWDKQDHAIVVW